MLHVWGRVAYRVLVGKPEGKRTLGRSRPRWEDNIEIDLREVECGGIDWIELAQQAEGACEYGNTFGFHKMRGIS